MTEITRLTKCLPERLAAYHCGKLSGCRAAGRCRGPWRPRTRRRTCTGPNDSCSGMIVSAPRARGSGILCL